MPTVGRSSVAPPQISLPSLLSTCVDACRRGCDEIRRVHADLDRTGAGSVSTVDYKISGDPRSALTAADLAAQTAIVSALESAWPGLKIVGEEDLACDISDAAGSAACSDPLLAGPAVAGSAPPPLRRDLCPELLPPRSSGDLIAALPDVTVFVDPLDGTREFVEGRVRNVQTLVGISVRGDSVGGAVGVPFPSDGDDQPVVAYGLVGSGFGLGYYGSRPEPSSTVHGGGAPVEGDRPLLVAGDVQGDAVLQIAYDAALSGGGRSTLLGGTGQKCLAVAEGRADVAVMNFLSSSWDTCASEALVRATGGDLTDAFGERIVYRAEPTSPATYLNAGGVVASAKGFAGLHREICASVRENGEARERLLGEWGMKEGKDVGRILDRRKEILREGL
eukprot:CAMPEP_0194316470 /NCGR_PEP_ID=MMETSP0171-20130528/13272_1 /TAXON_ID=218684 /ORGANISM="Corethron pennatum, Strain L29A3" /LENGTH=391 /DNA_ID=CAMNT_0039072721 /DNA_START=234 /DNA_END=1409 /DNA_ORIENTATION=-